MSDVHEPGAVYSTKQVKMHLARYIDAVRPHENLFSHCH